MLDDAHRTYYQWELCIVEMEDEIEYIINVLKNKFNIQAYIRQDIRYLYFTSNNSLKIDKIILNNIPSNLDIIKYKILEKRFKSN